MLHSVGGWVGGWKRKVNTCKSCRRNIVAVVLKVPRYNPISMMKRRVGSAASSLIRSPPIPPRYRCWWLNVAVGLFLYRPQNCTVHELQEKYAVYTVNNTLGVFLSGQMPGAYFEFPHNRNRGRSQPPPGCEMFSWDYWTIINACGVVNKRYCVVWHSSEGWILPAKSSLHRSLQALRQFHMVFSCVGICRHLYISMVTFTAVYLKGVHACIAAQLVPNVAQRKGLWWITNYPCILFLYLHHPPRSVPWVSQGQVG